MLVVCNFYKTEVVWDSGMDLKGFETLLGNYSEQKIEESKISLKPYEAMVLYRKRLYMNLSTDIFEKSVWIIIVACRFLAVGC